MKIPMTTVRVLVEERAVSVLREFGPECVCAGHCTGAAAEAALGAAFGYRFQRLQAGLTLEL